MMLGYRLFFSEGARIKTVLSKYIVFMAATMSEKERSNQLATIFQKRSVADCGLV
jgi:hypothetical protein